MPDADYETESCGHPSHTLGPDAVQTSLKNKPEYHAEFLFSISTTTSIFDSALEVRENRVADFRRSLRETTRVPFPRGSRNLALI